MAKLDLSIVEDGILKVEIQLSKKETLKGELILSYENFLYIQDNVEDIATLPKMLFGEKVYEDVIKKLPMKKMNMIVAFCYEEMTKVIKAGEESPSEE